MNSACPSCGKTLDATMHPFGDAKPEVGDLSVCFYCGAWLMFTETAPPGPECRLLTDEEKQHLLAGEFQQMVQVAAAVKDVRKQLSGVSL